MRPVLLRPDNFTPPTRTPWGGHKITQHFKRGLLPHVAGPRPVVGESWEVSVEPSFPSRLADGDRSLADAIADDPAAWLGAASAQRYRGQMPLLVKLIDAAQNLSVQVHPADDDPKLARGQSGKPEAWYVLDCEPGAGIFLGFADGVSRREVEHYLKTEGPLDELLNFVPVTVGDTFVIEAGVVHAIGQGVTLLEAQHVLPGCEGVTYRYWDWNRRYDEQGRLCPTGTPRPLHVAESLDTTCWGLECGQRAIEACRMAPVYLSHSSGSGSDPAVRVLVIDWHHLALERWAGVGRLSIDRSVPGTGAGRSIDDEAAMLAIVAVRGRATVHTSIGSVIMRCGQSAVIPAAARDIEVELDAAELLVTRQS